MSRLDRRHRPRRSPGPSATVPARIVLALVLGVVLLGCAAADTPATPELAARIEVPALHPDIDGWAATVVTLRSPSAEPVTVHARVADTAERRSRGLMHVPAVPDGAGMLFVFDGPNRGGFWMRDTLVPLDIGFIDAQSELTAVLTMVPCAADPCPVYDPEVTYVAALEVPAGWFARVGVEVGAEVTWQPPAPAPAAPTPAAVSVEPG